MVYLISCTIWGIVRKWCRTSLKLCNCAKALCPPKHLNAAENVSMAAFLQQSTLVDMKLLFCLSVIAHVDCTMHRLVGVFFLPPRLHCGQLRKKGTLTNPAFLQSLTFFKSSIYKKRFYLALPLQTIGKICWPLEKKCLQYQHITVWLNSESS